MHEVLVFISRLAWAVLVLGLFAPQYVLFWTPIKTKTRAAVVFLPIALILFAATVLTSPAKKTQEADANPASMSQEIVTLDSLMPPDEKEYLRIVDQDANLYKKSTDAAERTKIAKQHEEAINALNPGIKNITNWIGTIKQLGETDGKAAVLIAVGDRTVLQTYTDPKSDDSGTLIPRDSDLYKKLTALSPGNPVRFSAEMVKAMGGDEAQTMLKPTYIVKFTQLETVQ